MSDTVNPLRVSSGQSDSVDTEVAAQKSIQMSTTTTTTTVAAATGEAKNTPTRRPSRRKSTGFGTSNTNNPLIKRNSSAAQPQMSDAQIPIYNRKNPAIVPAYPRPYTPKGLGFVYGVNQETSHDNVIAPQVRDRMDPRELGHFFLEPGERFIHPEKFALACRSIELERTRRSPTGSQLSSILGKDYLWDMPLEELPGRVVLFTNKRVLIVDSSALDIQKFTAELLNEYQHFIKLEEFHEAHKVQEEAAVKKEYQGKRWSIKIQRTAAPAVKKDPIGCIASNIPVDTVYTGEQQDTLGNPLNLRYNRTVKFSGPGFNNAGFSAPERKLPPGPSANAHAGGSLPLTMGAATGSEIQTVDFTYFRSFPLSEVEDVSMDFISATRTSGHDTGQADLRSTCERICDCCLKNHTKVGGGLDPLLSLGAAFCLMVVYGAQHDKSWVKGAVKKDQIPLSPSSSAALVGAAESQWQLGMAFSAIVFFIQLFQFYLYLKRVCCKKIEVLNLGVKRESHRYVRITLKEHGDLILNVSQVHPSADIAECVSILAPKTSEIQKLKAKFHAVNTTAQNAVVKAQTDINEALKNEIREMRQVADELRAGASAALERTYNIAVAESQQNRYNRQGKTN